jgi:hypothetical protein
LEVLPKDREILRRLASQIAVTAALPVQREKAEMWRRLNDLEPVRPMVWITEVPWHEMNVDGELAVTCEGKWARGMEANLRRLLYQWNHFPCDMVVEDYLSCPMAIGNTRFGISEQTEIVRTDPASGIFSRHYKRQIFGPEDVEKIKMPVVTHDAAKTEELYAAMVGVFGGIMPVKKEGIKHIWHTPWDNLIAWWGVEDMMMDLAMRPEMVNAIVERVVDSCMCGLDQMEQQGLLTVYNANMRVGSGGYGYTKELPVMAPDGQPGRPDQMWGCSNAQIFVGVSPEMHWEFALRHDIRWFERWGMNYYGCCEPLDTKMEYVRRIPRLRKVSASAWVDAERMARQVGRDYVISRKPSPALLADATWDAELAGKDLADFIEAAEGCSLEVILKDISTVRHEPTRLWEWAKVAMEEVQKH